jgi:hypothetical protein
MPAHRVDPQERVWRNVSMEPMSGCWLWTGAITKCGYGSTPTGFKKDGTRRRIPAHRFSFMAFRGSIPVGLDLDHLCRNRCCVNPDHLEPVTRRVNLLRGVNTPGSRTHCPRGHDYRTAPSGRYCPTCSVENLKRYRAKKRGMNV